MCGVSLNRKEETEETQESKRQSKSAKSHHEMNDKTQALIPATIFHYTIHQERK